MTENTIPTATALTAKPWGAPPAMTKQQKDAILQQWLDASKLMADAKDAEMILRKQVVSMFPELDGKKEGTAYADLAAGWKLKVVAKQNYNLKDKDGATDKALEAYEKAAGTPEEFGRRKLETERLVSWKPSLSIKEYREASPELVKAIADVLTITDGAPTLELIDPNAKKK